MAVSFVRQLGEETGVQLNPLRDNSEFPAGDLSDQIFACALRSKRGRIDRPFKVHRGNVSIKLGKGETIKASALNEAWVQVVEALNNGAYEAVIHRLITPSAVLNNIVAEISALGQSTMTYVAADDAGVALLTSWLFSVKHLECHNDGLQVEFHADELKVGGVLAPNPYLTLRLRDADGELLYEFYGSLDKTSVDDYGNSAYLPDVVASQTDAVEVTVGTATQIEIDSKGYGYNLAGIEKWERSGVVTYFTEGGTAYALSDYRLARERLQYTAYDYGYIASGGTQSVGLLAQFALLAFDTNRQLRFDVPGNLTVDAAVTFVDQLSMGASTTAHLMHAFWAPFLSDDPAGVNGRNYFGTSGLNIGLACRRNAQTNAKGFAPKNYPIAGRLFPLNRTRMTQTATLRDQDLNALAKAKINPVIYETFSGGGRFVFRDSLTSALTVSSLKKLISVADMSCAVDDAVTRYGHDVLQLPMAIAITRMKDFLQAYFEAAEASGWLVPSSDPIMEGASYRFDVRANALRPYDRMDVSYWLRYDGTVRQIFVTQTLSK